MVLCNVYSYNQVIHAPYNFVMNDAYCTSNARSSSNNSNCFFTGVSVWQIENFVPTRVDDGMLIVKTSLVVRTLRCYVISSNFLNK